MSHEKTITIEVDGKIFNIPTVVRGKQLSDNQAFQNFKKTHRHFGQFRKMEGALFSAGRRSALGHGSDRTKFTSKGSRISTKRVDFEKEEKRKAGRQNSPFKTVNPPNFQAIGKLGKLSV